MIPLLPPRRKAFAEDLSCSDDLGKDPSDVHRPGLPALGSAGRVGGLLEEGRLGFGLKMPEDARSVIRVKGNSETPTTSHGTQDFFKPESK